ncbi:hypothetical protein EZMO1_1403 [Endozoicomonas montiporae CL-33]|uniref:Uncharacterized protein n=1 Tax=Endozoicomonas montiporae CL-33 TaxID=570277 RepID=A0A142BA15_9GAMM|nr:hypothetical protein EZMO1_1403 [Endozoicomonas montiporae CL-33]
MNTTENMIFDRALRHMEELTQHNNHTECYIAGCGLLGKSASNVNSALI